MLKSTPARNIQWAKVNIAVMGNLLNALGMPRPLARES
jgi:hypothetical protein